MLEQKGDSQWEAREGAGMVEDSGEPQVGEASGIGAKKVKGSVGKKKKESAADNLQLSFFQLEDPLLCDLRDSIKAMDINTMSPLDAFDAIRRLKEKLGLKH
jgi:hypothetical protein